MNRHSVRVELGDTLYPERLSVIMGKKAPKHLDLLGNVELLIMAGLGFSGSRKASLAGLSTAQDCAEQTVRRNVAAVSGNAKGVDFSVHYHCLREGGKTILVLPEGINHFQIKKEFQPVWDWERVLVISQFEPNDSWQAFRALTRNQLIIALSRAVIVVEAGEKGGSLHTGRESLKLELPLYVGCAESPGGKILLNMGAQKIANNATTNRADLTKVFESVREDKILKSISQQGDLI